ncbi:MAG: hypothetical protein V7676_12435 [Parasphingorhabdus sp.]|uniref:hypothetical protein n=1 Tax=Parasphingorhabdus sp. TaxID=2709688 RepID=UPI0030027542
MIGTLLSKEAFGAVALILTFAAFYPYIGSILRDETRPHVFSWSIWGIGTVVVFIAQLLDGGGVGAWVIGVSGIITLYVAVLAWIKSRDLSIVRMDWVFLVLAFSALPLWFFTETALSAVIVLTLVDLLGFGPSIRKAYEIPHEENATFFGIGALRNMFVVLALENYSWTTVLFPAAVGIACGLFVLLITIRRRVLAVET